MMLNVAKYLYFKMYSYSLKEWGKNENPILMALIAVSLVLFIHLVIVFFVLAHLINFKFDLNLEGKTIIIFVFLLLILISYLTLGKKDKHKKLIEEYTNINKEREQRFNKNITAYFIILIIGMLLFISLSQ